MFEIGLDEVFADLDRALDQLAALALGRLSDDEVLALLREKEIRLRRLAVLDQAVIAEADSRGLAQPRGCASTVQLLVQALRIGHSEAKARVASARQLAPRRGLSGEPMPAEFPQVAAGQSAGVVSAAQARVITAMISTLPAAVRDESFDLVEANLVAQAAQHGPDLLRQIARRYSDLLDPDGTLRDAAYRERTRDFTVHQRPDGSSHGTFDLPALTTEALLTALDVLAAPKPAADGVKDGRSTGQRRADAFGDLMTLVLQAGQLPMANGVTTTILITADAIDYLNGTGLATTGHGTTIPMTQAQQLAGQARFIGVLLDHAGRVTAQTHTRRLFTEGQRLAMIARDRGCSFPGCTVPPLWTQAHHITQYADTGRTTIDDGTLLCGHHHRHFADLGYTCTMTDGVPHWTPPRWIDPDQRPRRNHAHRPPVPTDVGID